LRADFSQFILHPSIIDGALQTIGCLLNPGTAATPYLPFALDELELVKPVVSTCYAYAERVEVPGKDRAGVMKFNIRILSERGDVLVRMNNLCVRPLPAPQEGSHAPAVDRSGH
jgi:hypothetical protein